MTLCLIVCLIGSTVSVLHTLFLPRSYNGVHEGGFPLDFHPLQLASQTSSHSQCTVNMSLVHESLDQASIPGVANSYLQRSCQMIVSLAYCNG